MKKIFGIPILLLVAIIVASVSTAVVVKYLSNTVTHTVEMSSPLQMTGDTDLNISAYGGDNIYYEVTTKNLASVDLESYPVTEITGPGNWQGNEITEIWLEDPYGLYNVTAIVFIIKDDGTLIPFTDAASLSTDTLKLYFDNTATGTLHAYARPVGFNEWNYITITTSPVMTPGEYTIKSCQLFDPIEGNC